jgi:hypothetical protein
MNASVLGDYHHMSKKKFTAVKNILPLASA